MDENSEQLKQQTAVEDQEEMTENRRNKQKIKATIYLTEEAEQAFTELYVHRLRKDRKTDRSLIACDAIQMLFEKECVSAIDKLQKVTIYLDGSVNVKGFKEKHNHCRFLLSPYDSPSQRRKDIKWELAIPSKAQWNDCNMPWEKINHSWDSHTESENLDKIYAIIGNDPQERRDGLHLDSAFKSRAHVFLTSDKDNIWKHRHALEPLLGFRIFCPDLEINELKEFINKFVSESFLAIPFIETVEHPIQAANDDRSPQNL